MSRDHYNGVPRPTLNFNILDAGVTKLPQYSSAGRPAANTVPIGTAIFNTDDSAPNYSDGAAWRDSNGSLT